MCWGLSTRVLGCQSSPSEARLWNSDLCLSVTFNHESTQYLQVLGDVMSSFHT